MATYRYSQDPCLYCGRTDVPVYHVTDMCLACSYDLYDYEPAVHDMWRFGWDRKNGKKNVYLHTRKVEEWRFSST